MSKQKTHWKKTVDKNYLGSHNFEPDEKNKILTISKVEIGKEIHNPTTNDKENKNVIHFKENEKPLILNSTNMDAIEKASGTPYLEEWVGTVIKLIVTKVKAFGEMVDAVRVVPKKASKQKPTLSPKHPKYSSIMKNAKAGSLTLDTVKEHFKVPADLAKKIAKLIEESDG